MMAKILLVDDDPKARKAVRSCLSKMGHKIIESMGEDSAISTAHREKLDAVILDMDIAGGRAAHICEKLSSETIPVLAISSSKSLNDVETLFDRGAAAYISKPFAPDQLILKLSSILNRITAPDAFSVRDVPPELLDTFRRAEDESGRLGDMAEIFDGVVLRSKSYRRGASPGPGWEPVITEDSIEQFRTAPQRMFVKFDRLGIVRVPHPEEYDQPEKVLVRRTAPPVMATLDRSRDAIMSGLYSIIPARGLGCGYLTCLLNSRLFDFFFNRIRPIRNGSYLRKIDLEAIPIIVPSLKMQEGFSLIARQLCYSQTDPRSIARKQLRSQSLARMNRMIFDIYGMDDAVVRRLTELHF